MLPRRAALLLLLAPVACVTPRHHLQRIGERRAPRAEPCEHPTIYTDHGPERPHESLAVVTAECGPSAEAECRRELQRGACEVQADAVIDVTDRTARRVRRMVGVAVEYRP